MLVTAYTVRLCVFDGFIIKVGIIYAISKLGSLVQRFVGFVQVFILETNSIEDIATN